MTVLRYLLNAFEHIKGQTGFQLSTQKEEDTINMIRSFLTGSILCAIINNSIDAKRINLADYNLTTMDLIKKEGYNAEEHNVVTEDGYILTLHRIRGNPGSPPVFLQHGLLVSSFEWLLSGKENSLGFYLADKGYDVWLGNSRGNVYSRRHVEFDPSEPRFWNFSWHEKGMYDVPAAVDYITTIKNESLLYIGHSMGTTVFFVMASEKPEIAAKIKAMFALAPVVFLDHSNTIFNYFHSFTDLLEMLFQSLGIHEVVPPEMKGLFQNFVEQKCMNKEELNFDNFCAKLAHIIVGYNPSRFNYSVAPMVLNNAPRGASVKTFMHYFQVAHSGQFRQYNYGLAENLKIYNAYEPPEYNFSRIQVPIGIIWAEADYATQETDIKKLYKLLPKKLFNYKIPDSEFGHLDFLFSLDAAKYVHSMLASVMDKFRHTEITIIH